MSHVTTAVAQPTDLNALAAAAQKFGGVLERKSTYNWYGRHVGDYPIPAGIRREDLGKCDYVIRLPGVRYEVGVLKQGDKYTLLYDFYGSGGSHDGNRLREVFGDGLSKLCTSYNQAVVAQMAAVHGYTISECTQENGDVVWNLNKY